MERASISGDSPPPPEDSTDSQHVSNPEVNDIISIINNSSESEDNHTWFHHGTPVEAGDDPRPTPTTSMTSRNALSGVFYHTTAGDPMYAPFLPDPVILHDPSLTFIPEPVTVLASTAGLLCCRGRKTQLFYVCNPSSELFTVLPAPENVHGNAVSAVLVLDDRDYRLVCTYPITNIKDVVRIETFDSRCWKWNSSMEIIDEAKIVLDSGVAVGGSAFWRTEDGRVVCYEPTTDAVRVIVQPEGSVNWTLGEYKGGLCLISVEGLTGIVLLPDQLMESWKEEMRLYVGPYYRVLKDLPVPVQSQGGMDVLFWEDLTRAGGRQVVAHNVETRGCRLLADNVLKPGGKLVPYTSSFVRFRRKLGGKFFTKKASAGTSPRESTYKQFFEFTPELKASLEDWSGFGVESYAKLLSANKDGQVSKFLDSMRSEIRIFFIRVPAETPQPPPEEPRATIQRAITGLIGLAESNSCHISDVIESFKVLKMQFPREFEEDSLSLLGNWLASPLLKRRFTGWNPVEKPEYGIYLTGQLQALFNKEHYEDLLSFAVKPAIIAGLQQWNIRSPQPLMDFISLWCPYLSPDFTFSIMDLIVIPKLRRFIASWSVEQEGTTQLASVVRPWMNMLDRKRLLTLKADLKRRIENVTDQIRDLEKEPEHTSLIELIEPALKSIISLLDSVREEIKLRELM